MSWASIEGCGNTLGVRMSGGVGMSRCRWDLEPQSRFRGPAGTQLAPIYQHLPVLCLFGQPFNNLSFTFSYRLYFSIWLKARIHHGVIIFDQNIKICSGTTCPFSVEMRSPIRGGQACGTSTIDSSLLFPVHRYHHQPICYQASYYMYLHSRLCSMYIHWEAISEGV